MNGNEEEINDWFNQRKDKLLSEISFGLSVVNSFDFQL